MVCFPLPFVVAKLSVYLCVLGTRLALTRQALLRYDLRGMQGLVRGFNHFAIINFITADCMGKHLATSCYFMQNKARKK